MGELQITVWTGWNEEGTCHGGDVHRVNHSDVCLVGISCDKNVLTLCKKSRRRSGFGVSRGGLQIFTSPSNVSTRVILDRHLVTTTVLYYTIMKVKVKDFTDTVMSNLHVICKIYAKMG